MFYVRQIIEEGFDISNEIPLKIYQTHETIERVNKNDKLKKATESWKSQQKHGFEYIFMNNNESNVFIKTNFDERTYSAYKSLPMGVMKADLWRYCVIYHNGGIYADADTICNVDNFSQLIKDNNSLIFVVKETSNEFLCQWVFGAPKKSPILKKIITNCIEKIENIEEIKKTVIPNNIIHAITGPAMFTEAVLQFLKENNLTIQKLSEYENNKITSIPEINMPESIHFHKEVVIHLFAGSDEGGWKKEKDSVFKY
jgi:alpha 1,6-mannosyltransferase